MSDNPQRVRILCVDDHPIVRQGIAGLLAAEPDMALVAALIAQGNANKEIARALALSEETVKGQVRNILSKLDAKDRTHAAMIGLKRGIIQF
jgi:DNA-binding NarL/FixJ family response regulator